MRIGIVGSLRWQDKHKVIEVVNELPADCVLVVQPNRTCASRCATFVAEKRGLQVLRSNILGDCDRLIVFWDGNTRFTRRFIRAAQECGQAVTLYNAKHDSMEEV